MDNSVKDDEQFIKTVEKLINPGEVDLLYFFSTFIRYLPRKLFKKLLEKTSRQTPYMGFVIEPYSLFLFYKLKDLEKAQSLLPERYKLAKARIFDDDEPEYLYGMGVFNTRASTFWGSRLETYLIAEDTQTGLISWIFMDILSDTIIALPKEGIAPPNTERAVITTNAKGEIFLDFAHKTDEKVLTLKGNLEKGRKRRLQQDIWILGNTSISHSKELMDKDDDPFAVIFDPAEVETALDIPCEEFVINADSLLPDFAEKTLFKTACFPYTQHYIADSPGCRTYVKSKEDMIEHYNRISGLKNIKTFSAQSIKKKFIAGGLLNTILTIILLTILLLKI